METKSSSIKKGSRKKVVAEGVADAVPQNTSLSRNKTPLRATALSIFLHDFKKKKHYSLITITPVILLVLLFVFVGTNSDLLFQKKEGGVTAAPSTIIYTDSLYKFSFARPVAFAPLRESPDPATCLDTTLWSGKKIKNVTVAEMGSLFLVVGCSSFSDEVRDQFDGEHPMIYETKVLDKSARSLMFTARDGYVWRVLQVALDDTHYLELYHFHKEGVEGKAITEKEWNDMIASFVVVK